VTTDDYTIPVSTLDLRVALRCEAVRAEAEQMHATARRQVALALHIENADRWARANCPPGYTLSTKLVFSFRPDVNPVLGGTEHRG